MKALSLLILVSSSFAFSREFVDAESIQRILEHSRRTPVLSAIMHVEENTELTPEQIHEEVERLIQAEEREGDEILKEALRGKPLFDCELPADLAKAPRVVLSADMHAWELEADADRKESQARALELIRRTASSDPREKIYLRMEGNIRRDKEGADAWAADLGKSPYPYYDGIEREGSYFMTLMSQYLHAQWKVDDAENVAWAEKGLKYRTLFLKNLLRGRSMRKMYASIRPDLPPLPLSQIFDWVLEQGYPVNLDETVRTLQEKRWLADEQGWRQFSRHAFTVFFKRRMGLRNRTEIMRKALAYMDDPERYMDFQSHMMLTVRNADWAKGFAEDYCEYWKDGFDFYLQAGAGHFHGFTRHLKQALPTLRVVYEATKGVLQGMEETEVLLRKELDHHDH